ncbi:MAG: hypothetical protein EXS51_01615 [Candidatus Taylorbacteria bacterium]|nr:hypothetical protein [Candidatus Taylorbacteria bacterium]
MKCNTASTFCRIVLRGWRFYAPSFVEKLVRGYNSHISTHSLTTMKKYLSLTVLVLVGFFSFGVTVAHGATADWKVIKTDGVKELSGISCPEARTCYVVSGMYLSGGTGAIFKTTDGGDTFTVLKTPSIDPFHSISCPTVSTCYIAGDFGTLLKTSDGGENWSSSTLGSRGTPPQFTAVFATSEQTVLVVGRDGVFYRSEDGGASWSRPTLRSVADLHTIYFTDKMTGFIGGTDSAFFKTEDGGSTWTFQPALKGAKLISRLAGSGTSLMYAVGETVQKSTDGGATWTELTTAGNSRNRQTVAAPDTSTAYLVSETNTIFKTTNAGTSWESVAVFDNTFLRDLVCPGVSYCLAVGSAGKVYRLGTPPAPLPPPAPTPVVPPVVQTPVVVTPAPEPVRPTVTEKAKTAVSSGLTRTLKKGSTGNDVKKLQEILASVVGVYPGGEVTGYYGLATVKAVGLFQEKFSLVSAGETGYGQAGPKTRAKLLELAESGPSATVTPATNSQTTPAVLHRMLKKGSRGGDVKKLQELLSADKEVYPEGELSGYFGPATAKAVGRFQEKHDIAYPGDDGYGEVGPKTRAKLFEKAE